MTVHLLLAGVDLVEVLGVDDALLHVHVEVALHEAREEGADRLERVGLSGGGNAALRDRAIHAGGELGGVLSVDDALLVLRARSTEVE